MSNSMKTRRVVRGIRKSVCTVLLLLPCGALSAENPERGVRNIVLVHGAWADGSGWRGVYDSLVRDGFNVSMVQEPETSFQDDVTAVKRIVELQDGPTILSRTAMGDPLLPKREPIHPLSDWCTSLRTCRMPERVNLRTESASPVSSANLPQ
jgi:hypothetical protein